MASIDFDVDDYLNDASEKYLIEELESRGFIISPDPNKNGPDYRMRSSEIPRILNEASDELRQVGKIALAWSLDEIRNGVLRA